MASGRDNRETREARKREYEERIFGEKAGSLSALRQLVLQEPLPIETEEEQACRTQKGECSTRGFLWKILLGVSRVDSKLYIELVSRGPSSLHEKIINDTCRTLRGNDRFQKYVSEDSLIRLLNAYVHFVGDSSICTYVQGLNVVAAPFLYTMPELFDEILEVVDSELHTHLMKYSHTAQIYAMRPILSLGAGIPTLHEVLRLWDFLFAFGPHLIVLSTIAHVRLLRDKILATSSPNTITRTLPNWNAELVIREAHHMAKQLPPSLYDKLARHTFDKECMVASDDFSVGSNRKEGKAKVFNKTWGPRQVIKK